VISLAVGAAGWVGATHPEITPPSNFHHFRDTTMIDGTIVKVHRHGQGAKGGLKARPLGALVAA
jgi:hypothetical protein